MDDRPVLIRASDFLMIAAFFLSLFASPFQALFYLSLAFSAVDRLVSKREAPAGGRSGDRSDILLTIFLGMTLIGAWTARYPVSALEGTAVFTIYVLVYRLSKSYPMDERRYRAIAGATGVGLVLACGFALLHYFVIREPIRLNLPVLGLTDFPATYQLQGGSPLISILQNSSLGGNILAFLITFISGYLFGRGKGVKAWEWIVFIPAVCLGLTTLVLTNTRGAYLFVFVSAVTLLVLYRKYLLLILPALLIAVILLLPVEKIRQTVRDPLGSPNMRGRFLQYRAGLEVLLERNPLWGIGLRNFQYAYFENYSGEREFERFPDGEIITNGPGKKFLCLEEYRIRNMPVPYIHNTYLSTLAETGVIGFLALFLFWFWILTANLRDFRRQNDAVSATAVAVMTGFFANSLFDNLLYTVPFAVLLWWLIGLSRNRALKEQWRTRTQHD